MSLLGLAIPTPLTLLRHFAFCPLLFFLHKICLIDIFGQCPVRKTSTTFGLHRHVAFLQCVPASHGICFGCHCGTPAPAAPAPRTRRPTKGTAPTSARCCGAWASCCNSCACTTKYRPNTRLFLVLPVKQHFFCLLVAFHGLITLPLVFPGGIISMRFHCLQILFQKFPNNLWDTVYLSDTVAIRRSIISELQSLFKVLVIMLIATPTSVYCQKRIWELLAFSQQSPHCTQAIHSGC